MKANGGKRKEIGLAVVGSGTIGRIRAILAKDYPGVGWLGIFTMSDGTIWSMNISWALPIVWPGAVYGLEIGIVGTKGVITVDDTHRNLVLTMAMGLSAERGVALKFPLDEEEFYK